MRDTLDDSRRISIVGPAGALALIALACVSARANAEVAKPIAEFAAPDTGHFDDEFLMLSDGKSVYYTIVDGVSKPKHFTRAVGGEPKPIAGNLGVYRPVRVKVDKSGRVRVGKDLCEVLWTEPTRIAARRPGEYDKARDVRRPDRFILVDTQTAKVIAEHEITDPLELARIARLHEEHVGLDVFVHASLDGKWLKIVDGEKEWEITELARPLAKYDPQTLAFQRIDEGHLLLSLTVDPVNREAVERKKADADEIDFYVVDLAAKKAARQLTVDGKGRPSKWHYASNRLAVLRKSKAFDTGGVAIEIFELPALSSAR